MTLILFSYLASVIVLTAILVVALQKPIYSAIALLVMFFHVSGLYLLLNAEFIAAIQIIVYAGAILVLYLFVVMLLNVRADEGYHKQLTIALIFGLVILVETIVILARSGFGDLTGDSTGPAGSSLEAMSSSGNTEALGQVLYTTYLLPFEVASLILLVAMIGSIILSKKGIFSE